MDWTGEGAMTDSAPRNEPETENRQGLSDELNALEYFIGRTDRKLYRSQAEKRLVERWVRRKKARLRRVERLCTEAEIPQTDATQGQIHHSIERIRHQLLRYRILRRYPLFKYIALWYSRAEGESETESENAFLPSEGAEIAREEHSQVEEIDFTETVSLCGICNTFPSQETYKTPNRIPTPPPPPNNYYSDTFAPLGIVAHIGANRIHFGGPITETKFGTDADQANDCNILKATLLRYTGTRDLTWDNLTGGAEVPVGEEAVIGKINTPNNRSKWTSFFNRIHESGLHVSLICLNWEDRIDEPESYRNFPYDVERDEGVLEPIELSWHDDHGSNVTTDTLLETTLLDIRNEYEVTHLVYMAKGIAELLGAIQEDIEFDLSSVLSSLEIFNWIDDRNVIYHLDDSPPKVAYRKGDAAASATYWSIAYFRIATQLYNSLKTNSLDIPIFIPGMSSYFESKWRNSLEYKLEFLSTFTAGITLGNMVYSLLTGHYQELIDIAGGMDWSWYHRTKAKSTGLEDDGCYQLGPAHIGSLAGELALVRGTIDDVGLEEAEVRVMSSGISATDLDEALPEWAKLVEWQVPVDTDTDNRENFQAQEVWRRLFGALSAGADAVGWDGWMSYQTVGEKEYYGMGLRDDSHDPTSSPSLSVQRPSWHAFRKLTQQFDGPLSTFSSVRFINPPNPTADFIPDSEEDYLVIMEIGSGLLLVKQYLYLLIVDPTFKRETHSFYQGAMYQYYVDIKWSGNITGTCKNVASWPNDSPMVGVRSMTSTLPTAFAVYDADVDITPLSRTIFISGDEAPLIIRSTQRLEFGISHVYPIDMEPHPIKLGELAQENDNRRTWIDGVQVKEP